MNTEMQTTLEKLKRLSEGLYTRDEANYYLQRMHMDSYVNSKCIKPEQKESQGRPSFVLAIVFLIVSIVFAFGALLCLVLFIVSVYPRGAATAIWLGAFAIVFLVVGLIINIVQKGDLEKITQQNKEATEFNTFEYPKLLSAYNDQVIAARQEFNEMKSQLIEKKEWADSVILQEGGIISPKFYPDVDRIITVIEDRRADTLKEAINRMLDDKQQEAMLALQMDQNKKLEAQNRKLDRQSVQLQGIATAALEAAIAAEVSARNSAETANNTDYIARQLGRR